MQLPSLILLYSCIDALGWLATEQTNHKTQLTFTEWVDRYLLPQRPLPCTALELYAARCGVLHTLTPDSDLAKEGKVRRVAYAWGKASVHELQQSLDGSTAAQFVAVHIDDLWDGLRLGTAQLFEDATKDASLAQRMRERGLRYFSYVRPASSTTQ